MRPWEPNIDTSWEPLQMIQYRRKWLFSSLPATRQRYSLELTSAARLSRGSIMLNLGSLEVPPLDPWLSASPSRVVWLCRLNPFYQDGKICQRKNQIERFLTQTAFPASAFIDLRFYT